MMAPAETGAEHQKEELLAALAEVKGHLDRHAAGKPVARARKGDQAPAAPATVERVVALFGLSPFERATLLLCAGVELDSAFGAACAAAQGDERKVRPTFSLALAALPDAHWSALVPEAPLRRYRLVEVTAGESLVRAPLRIDERVLHYLVGVRYLDERLSLIAHAVHDEAPLARSQEALARRLSQVWSRPDFGGPPIIQLLGADGPAARAVAAKACRSIGLDLWAAPSGLLPTHPAELEEFLRSWERESMLGGRALLLELDGEGGETDRTGVLAALLERVAAPMLVSGARRLRGTRRPLVALDLPVPAEAEHRAQWEEVLTGIKPAPDVGPLAEHFLLNPTAVQAAFSDAAGSVEPDAGVAAWEAALWQACRAQARSALEGLADRIESRVGWKDLVLPSTQLGALKTIASQVRQRARVYREWGFGRAGARGLGISTLFAGESGTGKTLAAEVLANELGLDLWRIDLSQVVSKYIGETEKNLRRVFDAAEGGSAVLLFDEADALFGRRSEVKDSHDRYANIEVSYLLQRMESYRGLSILTTNMKEAIDQAFLRRIRFVVQFPFPDAASRQEIWKCVIPAETPTKGLDFAKLARLNVTGGNIRNIALNGAFRAADAGGPLRMAHLLEAARSECAKLERPLAEAEIRGWA